jgi:hypothetical protein
MDSARRTMITLGFLILLVFGLYYFSDWFSKTTGYVLGEDEKVTLAQCLSSNAAVFYRSTTCPACEEQLALFGETASAFLTIETCTVATCPAGGVPAWKISGQIFYGVLTLQELVDLSSCVDPSEPERP